MSHRICRKRLCLIFALLLIFAVLGVAGTEALAQNNRRRETARPRTTGSQVQVNEAPEVGVSDATAADPTGYYESINEQSLYDSALATSQACNPCTLANQQPLRDRQCQKTYQNMYSKEPIDIRVVIGYMDNRSAGYKGKDAGRAKLTQDRYLEAAMKQRFMRDDMPGCSHDPDRSARFDCGFQQSPDNMSLVRTVRAPDGSKRTVKLTIVRSSETDFDESNQAGGASAALQRERTQRNENLFYGGFENADALLYVGHMRNGGGPDFGPPRLRADNHVNYTSYQSDRNTDVANRSSSDPSRRSTPAKSAYGRMLEAAEKAQARGRSPALVGILACDSETLAKEMRDVLPQSGIALTPKILFENEYIQATGLIESVLNYRCDDEMNRIVNATTEVAGEGAKPIRNIDMVRRTQTRPNVGGPIRTPPAPTYQTADPNLAGADTDQAPPSNLNQGWNTQVIMTPQAGRSLPPSGPDPAPMEYTRSSSWSLGWGSRRAPQQPVAPPSAAGSDAEFDSILHPQTTSGATRY